MWGQRRPVNPMLSALPDLHGSVGMATDLDQHGVRAIFRLQYPCGIPDFEIRPAGGIPAQFLNKAGANAPMVVAVPFHTFGKTIADLIDPTGRLVTVDCRAEFAIIVHSLKNDFLRHLFLLLEG